MNTNSKVSPTIMIELDHKNQTVEFGPSIDGWSSTKDVDVIKPSTLKELIAIEIPNKYIEV